METLADFNDTASVSARSGPPRPCYVSQPQAVAAIDPHVIPGDAERSILEHEPSIVEVGEAGQPLRGRFGDE